MLSAIIPNQSELLGQVTVFFPGHLIGIGQTSFIENLLIVEEGMSAVAVRQAIIAAFFVSYFGKACTIHGQIDPAVLDGISQIRQVTVIAARDVVLHVLRAEQIEICAARQHHNNFILIGMIAIDVVQVHIDFILRSVESVYNGGHVGFLVTPGIILQRHLFIVFRQCGAGGQQQRRCQQDG